MEKMEPELYDFVQREIITVAHMIVSLPLKTFLDQIDHAEVVGPILNPTLYIKAMDNLSQIKTVAQILRNAQTEIEKLRPDTERVILRGEDGAKTRVFDKTGTGSNTNDDGWSPGIR